MIKHIVLVATAAVLSMGTAGNSTLPSGSLRIDSHHSSAQLSADGTTGFGKTKTMFTVGVGRVTGRVNLNDTDPAQSTFDFTIYPSTSMITPIDEEGKFRSEWAENAANHTLVCFHSKGVSTTADGKLQTTGNLVLTRVDRNIELTPNEAYAGPVYGPPMIHKFSRPATFVFDAPTAEQQISGSTRVVAEDFPQLVKTVLRTYWPPVIQDEQCQATRAGEDYSGARCTGTLIRVPDLPASGANAGEDYPGPANFNVVNGQHLTISVNLRVAPKAAAQAATAGN